MTSTVRTTSDLSKFSSWFLADRTATQYDRLLAESCRLFVRLSVRPYVCLHCGSQNRCTRLKFVPACSQ